jgi:hypothetical protein
MHERKTHVLSLEILIFIAFSVALTLLVKPISSVKSNNTRMSFANKIY